MNILLINGNVYESIAVMKGLEEIADADSV
jgi:hypothetical protein